MDRHQMRVALLKITVLALAATTWVFWSFVFATRPEEQAAVDPIAEIVRLPASLPAKIPLIQPVVRVMEPIAMDVVKVPCWDKAASDEKGLNAHWVRLTGRACDGAIDADAVTVRNLSNGFSATVFGNASISGLTTDFIPLETGRNEILIRMRRDGATVESRISFNRE